MKTGEEKLTPRSTFLDEQEDGTTPIHQMLDRVFEDTIDSGSEHFRDRDEVDGG